MPEGNTRAVEFKPPIEELAPPETGYLKYASSVRKEFGKVDLVGINGLIDNLPDSERDLKGQLRREYQIYLAEKIRTKALTPSEGQQRTRENPERAGLASFEQRILNGEFGSQREIYEDEGVGATSAIISRRLADIYEATRLDSISRTVTDRELEAAEKAKNYVQPILNGEFGLNQDINEAFLQDADLLPASLESSVEEIDSAQKTFEQAGLRLRDTREAEQSSLEVLLDIYRPTNVAGISLREYTETDLIFDLQTRPFLSAKAKDDLRYAFELRESLDPAQRQRAYEGIRDRKSEQLRTTGNVFLGDTLATSLAIQKAVTALESGDTKVAEDALSTDIRLIVGRRSARTAEDISNRITEIAERKTIEIISQYLYAAPPNFERVFEELEKFEPRQRSNRVIAENLSLIAQELELAQLESDFLRAPLTATSVLSEQYEFLQNAPARSQRYVEEISRLNSLAQDREAASIKLAFSSELVSEVLTRIEALPEIRSINDNYKLELLRNYAEFATSQGFEQYEIAAIASATETLEAHATETKRKKIKSVKFKDVAPEARRNIPIATEADAGFARSLDNGFYANVPLTERIAILDRFDRRVRPSEQFRLKELVAKADEYREILENRQSGAEAGRVATQIAGRISNFGFALARVEQAIEQNSFPPVLADRLLEIAKYYNIFFQARTDTYNMGSKAELVDRLADSIVEARGEAKYTDKKKLEAEIEFRNIGPADKERLLGLFDAIQELPASARLALEQGARLQDIRLQIVSENKGNNDSLLEQLRPLYSAEDTLNFFRLRERCLDDISFDTTEEVINELSTYTPKNPEETAELNKIFLLAIRRRQERTCDSIINELSDPNPDYGKIFATINQLNTDQPDAQEICRTLRQLAMTRETDQLALALSRDGLVASSTYEVDIADIDQTIPLRSNEYVTLVEKLKEEALEREYNSIQLAFYLDTANTVLNRIATLPENTPNQVMQKKRLFAEYIEFIEKKSDLRPEDFEITSNVSVEQVLQGPEFVLTPENLGINTKAFAYMKANFRGSVGLLVENLRAAKSTKRAMDRIVPKNKASAEANKFRRRRRNYRKQRPLSASEEERIKSFELGTAFNPLMVAAARADFGTTSAFVRAYLENRSNETKARLQDGQHIPVLVIGGGPGGIGVMSELVRKNPELAAQALLIDNADQVGGPFGVPRGPAWALNSASQVGDVEFIPDPDPGKFTEGQSVRDYADPTLGYPGERRAANPDSRDFSINRTNSFGPSPEQIAPKLRYVTNEDKEITDSLEAAVLIQNLALKTKLLKASPAPTPDHPDRIRAKLELTEADGTTRTIEVTTDMCFVSSGLGEETFGFNTQGKMAEKVIEKSKGSNKVPLLGTYLQMFKAFVDRTKTPEEKEPGEVVVIYGNGDSRRTMEEQLTRLFAEADANMAKIKKVYIIANGEDSKRARYLSRKDVQMKGNRPNIVTVIADKRVTDVGFADENENTLNVFDERGNYFTDPETGEPIVANHVISAAGFKPTSEEVFADYLEGESLRDGVDKLTLPGAPEISVADKLKKNPKIVFVQTASDAAFNQAKLAQLPDKSRAALLAVGPENAVAIGFRAPDTLAATKLTLDQYADSVELSKDEPPPRIVERKLLGKPVSEFTIPATIDPDDYRVQNDADPSRTASSLLAMLMNKYEFTLPQRQINQLNGTNIPGGVPAYTSQGLTGEIKLSMRLQREVQTKRNAKTYWEIIAAPAAGYAVATPVPGAIAKALTENLQNPTFQSYCAELISSSRSREPELTLALSFKNGRLQPATSYVE